MHKLTVTIDVSTDDIRDVLAWAAGGHPETYGDTARRWLKRYDSAAGADAREEIWSLMPPSLQYCVNEVEQGREEQLRALLAAELSADRTNGGLDA